MLVDSVAGDGEPLKQPGIVPKLSATPGAVGGPAPGLGQHTDAVLGDLGFTAEKIRELRKERII